MPKPGKAEKWAVRSARLSAALRENLKKRKQQARQRGLQGDLQRDPARNPAADAEIPQPGAALAQETEVPGKPKEPDFRRNRGSD